MRGLRRTIVPAALAASLLLAVGPAQARPGSLDPTFGRGGIVTTSFGSRNDAANAVAFQPDGKVVVSGFAQTAPNDSDFALARYKTDGSLDASFGEGGKVTTSLGPGCDRAGQVLLQPDGRIIAVGTSVEPPYCYGYYSNFALARYRTDGSVDKSFGSGGRATTGFGPQRKAAVVLGAVLQPDGKIVAVGFAQGALAAQFAIARFNSEGSLDTNFGTNGKLITRMSDRSFAYEAVLQPDGKIVVAGTQEHVSGFSNLVLVRYNAGGSLDLTFGHAGKVETSIGGHSGARAVALQRDGKIVAAGWAANPDSGFALARYKANGSLDVSFGVNGTVVTRSFGPEVQLAGADSIALQPDGKIVAGGSARTAERSLFALARYDEGGALNVGFGSEGTRTTRIGSYDDSIAAIALQHNGKIVVAGTTARAHYSPPGDSDFVVARYLGDDFCIVPRVKGRKLAKARRAVHKAHCAVGKIRKRFSNQVRRGRVISQKPKAGKKLPAYSKVRLVVSKGPRR